ncbi:MULTISPECIES: D-ribose pyranase [Pseudomonas]|jgi:D-ribose pyranase|uniref:D-ribose pyranase n=3 Tax=Pseudomonas chlororaphis TaxID=587753 RepID=A0AAD1E6I0_9PSED|nr:MULTISPECIES: D-ribose pyranase [Pseudomonas]AIC19198.1 ribose pyranase [Pseudomonas chlororaphis]AIS13846.1 ribose pyranase [Pseudomonas chlororaphis subsp. aurantiaca]AZD21393.1 Ribose ABC transport system, high affinity permease RbsD [Pseudomonas chlororaphis subsp. aurantiaca]AZD34958.1 Ribose ABC transport system, high affinity permease RbsD [Pseudomonas chlororaphis subsp. aurantiaca]AZD41293.1 Ribose ABC transport system, high affinity permease RbsD [Pseudomonas chlororaphis subsp. a
MKKTPLLNVALSRLIASLGHGDIVVIGDAGLPVPPGVELIDLALTQGIPDFLSTLQVVLCEMQVEGHVLAQEILDRQSPVLQALEALSTEGALGARKLLGHDEFKVLSRQARAIVRTGECQPYCNIALIAGVTF